MPGGIRRACAAQMRAAQAITRHGLTHPRAQAMLAAAAVLAAAALQAGHRVADVHHAPSPDRAEEGSP